MSSLKVSKQKSVGRCSINYDKDDDDVLSFCGSLSGETFSSRRRKNTCTLLQHNIDDLAQKLKLDSTLDASKETKQNHHHDRFGITNRPRCNTFFHHYRILVVMLGGFGFGLMLLLRYSMSIAVIHMVNQTALYLEEHPNRTVDDFLAEGYKLGGEFDWNNEIQQMLMSWYMICYTLPQLPLTKLALYMGNRWATFISLMICAISTILTPCAAYLGWEWVLVLRLFNGIGASAVLPMLLTLIEHWMPYDEITLGLTVAQVVQALLTATNPILIGWLAEMDWRYSFYVPGAITVIFCFLWFILITDCPDENRFISANELERICGCAKMVTNGMDDKCGKNKDRDSIEKSGSTGGEDDKIRGTWIDVLKTPVFYTYIIMMVVYCNAYNNFLFILPAYLRQFLKVGVTLNGTYCSIIQAGSIVAMIWPHPCLRILQNTFHFSLTTSRRILYALMCFMATSTWLYVGAFHHLQLIVLFINRCFYNSNDVLMVGALMSNFAKAELSSIAFSMINTVGNFSVVFGSTLLGYVLDQTGQSREAWGYIIMTMGLSQLITGALFCTVITSEPIKLKRKRLDVVAPEVKIDIVNNTNQKKSSEARLDIAVKNNFQALKDNNKA